MDNITNNNINTNTDNAETPDITKETNLGRQLSDDECKLITWLDKLITWLDLNNSRILLGLISAYIIIMVLMLVIASLGYLFG